MAKELPIRWFSVENDMKYMPEETNSVLAALQVSILRAGKSIRMFKHTLVKFAIKHQNKTLDGFGIVLWAPTAELTEKLQLVDTKDLYYILISDKDNLRLENNEPNNVIYCNLSSLGKANYRELMSPYTYERLSFTSFVVSLGNGDATVTKIVNIPRIEHKKLSTDPLTVVKNLNTAIIEALNLIENKSVNYEYLRGYLGVEIERNLEQSISDRETIGKIGSTLVSTVDVIKLIRHDTPLLAYYMITVVSDYVLETITGKISPDTLLTKTVYFTSSMMYIQGHIQHSSIDEEDISALDIPYELLSSSQKDLLSELNKYNCKADMLGLRSIDFSFVTMYNEPFFGKNVTLIKESDNSDKNSMLMLNLPISNEPYIIDIKHRLSISLNGNEDDYSSVCIPKYYTWYCWSKLLDNEFTKVYYKIKLFNAGIITLRKEEQTKMLDVLNSQVFKYSTGKILSSVYDEFDNLVASATLPLSLGDWKVKLNQIQH